MATSPPAPYNASLPNPKKRPSLPLAPQSSKPPKRPKLHPLRQTSFPAEHVSPFTPSARSETGSLVSGITSSSAQPNSASKRGRGRPKKTKGTPTQAHGADSPNNDTHTELTADQRASGRSVLSHGGGSAAHEESSDDEFGSVPLDLSTTARATREAERTAENLRINRLLSTFSPSQERRYSMFRRGYLQRSVLKRIVNSTVSQSVTAMPLVAIGAYTKYFAGEIVTRACDVQREYAKSWDEAREAEDKAARESGVELPEPVELGRNSAIGSLAQARERAALLKKRDVDRVNPHKGGLLPDHLREALRRYKADGEGGGVGFEGHSLGMLGTTGGAVWKVGNGLGGRRLFR